MNPSEDLASIQSFSFTSSVLQLLSVPYPAGYSGNILTVKILSGASPGSYLSNPFSLTYDSINGRTFTTNSVNLSVQVVPEPATFVLAAGFLTLLGVFRVSALQEPEYSGATRC